MAKCPKCNSDNYDTLYMEDVNFYDGDYATILVKAECFDCGKKFWVEEFYTYDKTENVDFE